MRFKSNIVCEFCGTVTDGKECVCMDRLNRKIHKRNKKYVQEQEMGGYDDEQFAISDIPD